MGELHMGEEYYLHELQQENMENKIEMVKYTITTENTETTLSYDRNRYTIKYDREFVDMEDEKYNYYQTRAEIFKGEKSIGVLELNERSCQVIQKYVNGISYFMTFERHSLYGEFKLYSDNNGKLKNEFCTSCESIEEIADNLYVITLCYNGGQVLFNLNLKQHRTSNTHTIIDCNSIESERRLAKNYIMVEDEIIARNNKNFVEYLVYGIDLDTFKIVTPIYSNYNKKYFRLIIDIDSIDDLVKRLEDDAKVGVKRKSLYINGKYNKEFGDKFKRDLFEINE